jgi:hypothetical protein
MEAAKAAGASWRLAVTSLTFTQGVQAGRADPVAGLPGQCDMVFPCLHS